MADFTATICVAPDNGLVAGHYENEVGVTLTLVEGWSAVDHRFYEAKRKIEKAVAGKKYGSEAALRRAIFNVFVQQRYTVEIVETGRQAKRE